MFTTCGSISLSLCVLFVLGRLMVICGWTTLTSQCPLKNEHKRQQICQIRHEIALWSSIWLRIIVMWQRLTANQIALFQECVVHPEWTSFFFFFYFCLFFRKWSQKVWSTRFSFNSENRVNHSVFSCLICQICCVLWSFSSGRCDVRVDHLHTIITSFVFLI